MHQPSNDIPLVCSAVALTTSRGTHASCSASGIARIHAANDGPASNPPAGTACNCCSTPRSSVRSSSAVLFLKGTYTAEHNSSNEIPIVPLLRLPTQTFSNSSQISRGAPRHTCCAAASPRRASSTCSSISVCVIPCCSGTSNMWPQFSRDIPGTHSDCRCQHSRESQPRRTSSDIVPSHATSASRVSATPAGTLENSPTKSFSICTMSALPDFLMGRRNAEHQLSTDILSRLSDDLSAGRSSSQATMSSHGIPLSHSLRSSSVPNPRSGTEAALGTTAATTPSGTAAPSRKRCPSRCMASCRDTFCTSTWSTLPQLSMDIPGRHLSFSNMGSSASQSMRSSRAVRDVLVSQAMSSSLDAKPSGGTPRCKRTATSRDWQSASVPPRVVHGM